MPLLRVPLSLVGDILSAFSLLTRLPLPSHESRGARAAWAWPLAGAAVGGIAGLVGWLIEGHGTAIAPVIVLAVLVMLTGAMHEDGLADTADGLWGGWTRERRLEIMKDSHIGTYGVLALVLVLIGRWSALLVLFGTGEYWLALVAAGALSRVPMAVLGCLMPNARKSGLSSAVGRPSPGTAFAALAIGLLVSVLALGPATALRAGLLVAVACGLLAVAARMRIGGQTGDILGASQQVAELAILAVLAGQA